MSVLLRARVSSFLAGVAVTGIYGTYQLRKDVTISHQLLADQILDYTSKTDQRIAALEAGVAKLEASKQPQ